VVCLVVVDEIAGVEALLFTRKAITFSIDAPQVIAMTLGRLTANSGSQVRRTGARHPSVGGSPPRCPFAARPSARPLATDPSIPYR
jgi:hypothetical protein